MMEDAYIIGLSVSIILTLIGILYRIMSSNVDKNTKEIKRVDEETDARLDDVEKDIVGIKAKNE